MSAEQETRFVSRAGEKLAHGLSQFGLSPEQWICADLGSSTGGFVDCLLQNKAAKVYAVDRGYGVLDYRLRTDPRVVVMERTDALQLRLPEEVQLITMDLGWTRQRLGLPAAMRLLAKDGHIISLIKPHYEADPTLLQGGVLPEEHLSMVIGTVRSVLDELNLHLVCEVASPICGRGGNREMLWHLRRKPSLAG